MDVDGCSILSSLNISSVNENCIGVDELVLTLLYYPLGSYEMMCLGQLDQLPLCHYFPDDLFFLVTLQMV